MGVGSASILLANLQGKLKRDPGSSYVVFFSPKACVRFSLLCFIKFLRFIQIRSGLSCHHRLQACLLSVLQQQETDVKKGLIFCQFTVIVHNSKAWMISIYSRYQSRGGFIYSHRFKVCKSLTRGVILFS